MKQAGHLHQPFPRMSQTPIWDRPFVSNSGGNAREYFGIWIVNILLTIVTFSLYAPWAKVRRLRYFYGNTVFYRRKFDFTGVPTRILIGRIIALGVYFGASALAQVSWQASLIGFLIIFLLGSVVGTFYYSLSVPGTVNLAIAAFILQAQPKKPISWR